MTRRIKGLPDYCKTNQGHKENPVNQGSDSEDLDAN